MILYYVHDPMCSWCWGFRATWRTIRENLHDSIDVIYLLGGLAADSDEIMPKAMQADIADYWRKIQKHIPGTQFNFDFWERCQPRRSTYPACRAVIAARKQAKNIEYSMIEAIQYAYYLNAKNPSDESVLIDLAESLKLDKQRFINDLNSKETQAELAQEIIFSQKIGAQGFPSLILQTKKGYMPVPLDYNDPDTILSFIKRISQWQ